MAEVEYTSVKKPLVEDFSSGSTRIRMWRTVQIVPAEVVSSRKLREDVRTTRLMWLSQECQGEWTLVDYTHQANTGDAGLQVEWRPWNDIAAPRPSRVILREVTPDGVLRRVVE